MFVDYVVQINIEADTCVSLCWVVSARQLNDVLIISIFCGFVD